MKKNNQITALFVLIPMLIFTLVVTLNTQTSSSYYNEAEYIIYKYFDYQNNKDLDSLSKLLLDKDSIYQFKSKIDNIENISILKIEEESNKSIINAYLRNDATLKSENVKIYKVSYEIKYNKEDTNNKNGSYESWYFLTRENNQSEWLIDIYDI
ncbi:MAG: DUF4829 domain-containing protein [Peptostreptococcaceae bacterium]